LVYTVDVTQPYGQRVTVESLADGSAFEESSEYNVAMTSYRASGGGSIMREGAGIDTDNIAQRTVAYHPEIREILYEYLVEHGEIAPEKIGDPAVIGSWKFIPEDLAEKALQRDMDLLF
jgi:2',3'-cyclic-nucleotide 2'-phosphodiesterase/3'-nucleotidase